MRVVLDTSVLIAAFAARGLCEAVLGLCLENHEIVLGQPLLLEVQESLRLKLRLPQPVVEEILDFLRAHSVLVDPRDVPADACRDPDDLVVLGTAGAAAATYIVTGDDDLLSLEAFGDIPILTPRKFWEREAGRETRNVEILQIREARSAPGSASPVPGTEIRGRHR